MIYSAFDRSISFARAHQDFSRETETLVLMTNAKLRERESDDDMMMMMMDAGTKRVNLR
jgi:hypothetical protein